MKIGSQRFNKFGEFMKVFFECSLRFEPMAYGSQEISLTSLLVTSFVLKNDTHQIYYKIKKASNYCIG